MKNTLMLAGRSLLFDPLMRAHILRHFDAAHIVIERTITCEEPAKILAEELSRLDETAELYIVCDPDQASLAARTLCTFTEDTIATRNDWLVPAQAQSHKTDYYTLEVNGGGVHVLVAFTGHDLPALLPPRHRENRTIVHLFDAPRPEVLRLLAQIESAFRVKSALSEPIPRWLHCVLRAEQFGDIIGAQAHLVAHFQTVIPGENIAAWLIETLENAQCTLTFAESCTGGLLSYFLTRESGASAVFDGGLVTYSNRLKSSWIAVEEATLEAYGAVSEPVVEAMSQGALDVANADYAIAVSGIAGPTGGTPDKPVGTVYIAVRSKNALRTARLVLHGDRNYVQEQTVLHAVKMLLFLDKSTFFKIS